MECHAFCIHPRQTKTTTTRRILMSKNDSSNDSDDEQQQNSLIDAPSDEFFDKLLEQRNKVIDPTRPDSFLDAYLEVPDRQLLAGDLLFILVINFLLQIANEVGDPQFWLAGGFSQPITMPITLLAVMVRDSKMSISWVLSSLWNRGYSSSSVEDDKVAAKKTFQIWIDYCSIRILMELGYSLLFSHAAIDGWLLFREVWYTAIVMTAFRIAYGRIWSL
jgi:hypothetical protein